MKNEKGFTLIEVMIAIAILALISVLMWQSMGVVVNAKNHFDKREEVYRGATLTLSQMTRDIQMAVIYASIDILGVSPSGEQAWKSAFIGVNKGEQDEINFNALSHLRYIKGTKESELAEVGYFLDQDEEEDEDNPGAQRFFELKKREQSPPDTDPLQGGNTVTILNRIKELNFRYLDPKTGEFVDEWDSTKLDYLGKMPRAVEIVLAVQDPNDESESITFSTTVLIEMSPGPNDF